MLSSNVLLNDDPFLTFKKQLDKINVYNLTPRQIPDVSL